MKGHARWFLTWFARRATPGRNPGAWVLGAGLPGLCRDSYQVGIRSASGSCSYHVPQPCRRVRGLAGAQARAHGRAQRAQDSGRGTEDFGSERVTPFGLAPVNPYQPLSSGKCIGSCMRYVVLVCKNYMYMCAPRRCAQAYKL